jgi:hypothetical protein
MAEYHAQSRMTRDQLVDLVSKIMRLEETGDILDEWVWQLKQNVAHPRVSDMIFWPDKQRTAEQIVDEALAWDPATDSKNPGTDKK